MDDILGVVVKLITGGYYSWKWFTEYNDRKTNSAPKTKPASKKSKKRKR